MKFARYLEDTQTPEWKRAYIDYRLLKKKIAAIQRASGVPHLDESPVIDQDEQLTPPPPSGQQNLYQTVSHDGVLSPAHSHHWQTSSAPFPEQSSVTSRVSLQRAQTLPVSIPASAHISPTQPPIRGRAPSFGRLFSSKKDSKNFMRLRPQPPHPYSDLPLRQLIPLLSPLERAFFSTLDAEVEKIETFYVTREEEMRQRTDLLEKQLEELSEHKKSLHTPRARRGTQI
ncbi:SPX domain-containing protein [Roridomyces roridus]|uniref:SPX domain-containing protein n=1 Tax=Roridomyces roridus TaxID=1738132 RepID=A0AAD7BZD6_9AGAR|nr:SPX domain-containing protein [Roridomyces roridus]